MESMKLVKRVRTVGKSGKRERYYSLTENGKMILKGSIPIRWSTRDS